jgi:hypothetical protein
MRKRLLVTYLALLICCVAGAKESIVSCKAGLLFNSAYLWRGEKVCGPNWQPEFELKVKDFKVLFYGYLPFDGSYKELDWELVYNIGDFSVHLGDYYFYSDGMGQVDNYFDWSKQTGGHVVEGALCYVPKELPFSVKWMAFLYGRYFPGPNGTKGAPVFSSYLELAAHHQFWNVCTGSVEVGMNIGKDAYTQFTEDFAFLHLALKLSRDFKLKSCTFPVGLTYLYNPFSKQAYFSVSGGIRF